MEVFIQKVALKLTEMMEVQAEVEVPEQALQVVQQLNLLNQANQEITDLETQEVHLNQNHLLH